MSIYATLTEKVKDGESFKLDLTKKSLKIGNKYFIKDGDVQIDDELISPQEIGDNPWEMISSLFRNYQRSVPSHKDKGHSYFKALDVDELSTGDLAYNEPRSIAQARLEGYILLASMLGAIEWQNESHWFWQDPTNSDCFILREWVK